jgi:hypothetical protein
MSIFFDHGRRKKRKTKDEFDNIINLIERFAPAKYKRERDMFYYNYRSIPAYRKPLFSLLEMLSRQKGPDLEEDLFADEVFENLKCFYDPKGKLSPKEAKMDANLMKKYRDLFQFFFNRKPPQQGN